MIERYTRPEIGAVWTDEAKLESWREVEVACALETEGPTPEDLEDLFENAPCGYLSLQPDGPRPWNERAEAEAALHRAGFG